MEENGKRRNPARKASLALRSLNTNSGNIKSRKSHKEAIFDIQEGKKNETAITTRANDKNSNNDSRKENM